MKIKTSLFLTVLLFACTIARSQDKIYMPFFQIENMHWEYQMSAAKIFKNYVNDINKYTLILPETKDTTYPKESFHQTILNAKTAGTKYFIIAEMNALNDVMIVSMTMYNTSDSSKVWNDLLKARTPDDLDPILQRLAKCLGTDKKASVDGDIYSVTNYDSKPLSKVNTSVNFGVAISGAYCFVNKVSNQTPAGFGLLASYDARDVIFDLQGDFLFGDIKMYGVRISGLYPFKSSKNTPYIGGSIAWSGTTLSSNDNSYYSTSHSGGGLAFYANGGYIFNRNSTVNFRVAGSIIIPTYKTDDNQVPLGLMMNVAILF